MLKSIRILIAIVTFYDYEIWQMDVKTAFLNGKLTEDLILNILIVCASFIGPFMDLSKLLVVGIFASMKRSRNLVL